MEYLQETDQLFRTIENYNEMTIEQLQVCVSNMCISLQFLHLHTPVYFPPQFSKIGKVMRHISVMPDDKTPREEEFKFRARAERLVEKWHEILNSNKPAT